MNIHEYQGKELLRKYGVTVPQGQVAFSAQDAFLAAQKLGGDVWVVKAQIHAGGRGKAGGVKILKSKEDVKEAAQKMLGMTLITDQTGPQGKEVGRVYVEEGCSIEHEYYLSLLVDRATSRLTFLASTEGGMDVEEVAENTPEKIIKVSIDPAMGFQPFHARELSFGLGLRGSPAKAFMKFATNLYQAAVELDTSLIEINPLITTTEGEVMALDAKISFDDNALFRHPDLEELRDESEEDPAEREADQHELNYIKLDGSIGCMVNGAGLAMATMDIIKLYGAEPANFLDVGGGATKDRVTVAFKLILSDPNVKGVLVNIFGGIMRCDIIAEGIVAAAKEVHLNVPLVVRLEGTNVDLGKEILRQSGLPIVPAEGLAEAAQTIVKAVKEAA